MKYALNGDLILCKKIDEIKTNDVDNIVITTADKINIYEIVDISFVDNNKKESFKFNIGDKIISCSTGTILDEDGINVIFQPQHIMCKV